MGSIRSLAPSSSSVRKGASRAADALNESADYAVEAGASARERLSGLFDDLQSMIARAQKVSGRELGGLRSQMSKKLDAASETLESLTDDASVATARTLKSAGQLVRSRPLQTVGVVAAAGLIVGFLLARRQS